LINFQFCRLLIFLDPPLGETRFYHRGVLAIPAGNYRISGA